MHRISLKTTLIIAGVMFIAGVLFAVKLGWIGNSDAVEYFHESKGKALIQPIGGLPSFSELVKKAKPAVVNISTTKKVQVRPFNPFREFGPGMGPRDPFEDFFERFSEGMPIEREQHSLGSGFIMNEEGYIVTNNHVIANADEVIVLLSDEKKYQAKVVGQDPKTDIAILKIKAEGSLPYVELGDSDKLETGDWVVAIGNPFALERTVTAGIVSAKGRVIGVGPYDNFIQTDASINPGNSGGPLFNLAGEVVGINTAIFAAGQGLGFAIPINIAKNLIPQLVKHGKVTDRGYLGVQIQPVTEELAKSFNLPEEQGALVGNVLPGSPAEKAGIKRGDIIIEFDGQKIHKAIELPGMVAAMPSGKTVKLKVFANGKERELSVTLGKQSAEEIAAKGAEEGETSAKADLLGLVVENLGAEEAGRLGIAPGKGVKIARVEPSSQAEAADVRSGDVLLEVNGTEVNNVSDYTKAASKLKKGDIARLLIKRGQATLYLAFKL